MSTQSIIDEHLIQYRSLCKIKSMMSNQFSIGCRWVFNPVLVTLWNKVGDEYSIKFFVSNGENDYCRTANFRVQEIFANFANMQDSRKISCTQIRKNFLSLNFPVLQYFQGVCIYLYTQNHIQKSGQAICRNPSIHPNLNIVLILSPHAHMHGALIWDAVATTLAARKHLYGE